MIIDLIEPVGGSYAALLRVALAYCVTGSVVVREELNLEEEGRSILRALGHDLDPPREVTEWPGTQLHGHAALLHEFRFNDRTLAVLLRIERLYAWVQPRLPEDLCLYRPNGAPWLVSISHERDSYLDLSEPECTQLSGLLATLRSPNDTDERSGN
jgi:hypothetical protein